MWFGTLCEVALPAGDDRDAHFAAAFAAIAHVHRTMSAHDAGSDLARIARDAHRRGVVVDAETFAVLELAKALWLQSGGAFDITIAPLLARDGLLPSAAAGHCAHAGRMDALHLDTGRRVRTDVPLALDLGGVAKGHAVDCAVAALRAMGVREGLVNAGGDLRVFGDGAWTPIRVRHPAMPTTMLQLFDVRDCAVATSADYFRASAGAWSTSARRRGAHCGASRAASRSSRRPARWPMR